LFGGGYYEDKTMPSKERCDKTQDIFSGVMDAKQIKALIKERGWNQKQIAEYWDMSENWISLLVKNDDGQRSIRDDCAFMGLPPK